MKYSEFYKLIAKFNKSLNNYVKVNDQVNDSYYVAKTFIAKIMDKAYKNTDYLQVAAKWIDKGKTIELKEALSHIGYNDSNLVHFNAMSMMDSVSLIIKNKQI